ncbi:MAG: Mut7-C RNAse domain-containing protein, partial [Planctomycetota bacterium]
RHAISERLVSCVFVPRGLSVVEQLAHVMAVVGLPLRDSRCMDCDGELAEVPLAEVAERVPRKVKEACSRFFRCAGCGKTYWHGTHWQSIEGRLRRAAEMARAWPGASESRIR